MCALPMREIPGGLSGIPQYLPFVRKLHGCASHSHSSLAYQAWQTRRVLPHRIRALALAGMVVVATSSASFALADGEYQPWQSSKWVGVAEGAPVPGVGLPPAVQPTPPMAYGEAYDITAAYEGQAQCDPTPKPGAVKLANLIKSTYGQNQTAWIPRACSEGGQSEHKEGRAIDWMTSIRDPQGRANAEAFLNWLLAPAADGTKYANARRLGVMYLAWNDRIWTSYDNKGWRELRGCFSTPDKGHDTWCHRDHIHISLDWNGASGKSSFWDGTPFDAPYCPRASSGATTSLATTGLALTPISPVRVLDTVNKVGITQRCRLEQDRWTGDSHRIFARVVGKGGIPKTGVSAVAIRVAAVQANAPGSLRVWSPGVASSSQVVSTVMNKNTEAVTVVPVASDGTIAIANQAGATDVTVDVLGYFMANTDRAKGGMLNVTGPVKAYDTTGEGGPIGPGETRAVSLAAKGGVGAGASGAFVAVTAADAPKAGVLVVGEGERAPRVAYRKVKPNVGSMLVPVAQDGTITLTNNGATAVNVRVDLLAWSGAGTGGDFVPTAPKKLASGTAVNAGAPVNIAVKGAPAGTKAVVLAASTSGSTADGWLSIGPTGATNLSVHSVGVVKAKKNSGLVIAPIGADGSITVTSPLATTSLTAYVIGYVK